MSQVSSVNGPKVAEGGSSSGQTKKVAKAGGQKLEAKASNPHLARKLSRLAEEAKGGGGAFPAGVSRR